MTERLSSIDAACLHLEEPACLMTITALLWSDVPWEEERLKALLRERLVARYPRFRQRVVPAGGLLSGEHWQDVPDFHLEEHLRRVVLPPPGGQEVLEALVSESMSLPLDRTKPLWELVLVEGLGQGSALLVRVHHAIADGISLARVLLSLTEEDTGGRASREEPEGAGEEELQPLVRLLRGAQSVVDSTKAAWRRGRGLVAEPFQLMDLAIQGAKGASVLSRLLSLPVEPPSPFRGDVGVEKRVAWSRPVPVAELRELGHATGSTVNDIVLAAASGALRRQVLARGMPAQDLRAAVPVNLRPVSEPLPRALGNQFGLVLLDLPVGVEPPLKRLGVLKRRMEALKRSPEAGVFFGLLSAVGYAPPALQRRVAEVASAAATLVMTNVPGPKRPVLLAGTPLAGVMFWVPLPVRLGLGLSLFSYAGQVRLSVSADAGRVPEPHALVEDFHAELEALKAAASSPAAGGR
jgi:WS/DGAT/MGAT family acyltransferase